MNNNLIPIISSIIAALSALGSGYLVYRASSKTTQVQSDGQTFNQRQAEIDGLRADLAERDEQNRALYYTNVALLQTNEKLRAWAYGLVRLLTDNGITDVPPEPEEAQ